MYREDTDRGPIFGMIGILVLLILGFWGCSHIDFKYHPRHFKQKVVKLKHGRYTYKDHKGQWWRYQAKRTAEALSKLDIDLVDTDFGGTWTGSAGTIRLPEGVWVKAEEPLAEEIEGELEVAVEVDSQGDPEADTDAGADSDASGSADAADAGSDSGGDGGDGGGDGGE